MIKYLKYLPVCLLLITLFSVTTAFAKIPNQGIGQIDVPPGVEKYQEASGADIGIIFFISNMLKVFAVVMGVWAVFNITLAGYIYLSSGGDAGAHEKVRTQVTNTIIGLLLIVMSYTIAGLIGFIFFGDATFILNPTLPTATAPITGAMP